MDTTVLFDGVWKKFRRGERHDSLRDLFPAALRRLVRSGQAPELDSAEFWALEDVSFQVGRGQALGIIGRNGAGKSTTLKLLTRILRANRGQCVVTGRVGALIEVAAGFHPDLTGRENVFLQGAVMGMKRAEIAASFDEIVEFAGVGAFIDTQVKRYSSGMNARLGFSIAAHLRPDVLIIDEVLSVGDAAFQDRCVQRMQAFRRNGVTIVFVSHNLQAIAALCDQALYLNRTVCAIGPTTDILDVYVRDSLVSVHASSSDDPQIRAARVVSADGAIVTGAVAPRTPLVLQADVFSTRPMSDVEVGFAVHRATDRLTVYQGHFMQSDLGGDALPTGAFTIDFGFDAHLARGHYFLEVFLRHMPTQEVLTRLLPAGHLTIDENRTTGSVVDLGVSTRVRRQGELYDSPAINGLVIA